MTIAAEVICDSISPQGIRLCTLRLRYPKFIHGEFMTHRVFSRNASSSRAIPVERLIRDVVDDPVYPSHWGANQRGMQASGECNNLVAKVGTEDTHATREGAWGIARQQAVDIAKAFAEAGYHKQIVNRLLEPFCHINVVVTATEWSNFFALRCHPDAQPEMRILAEAMRFAMSVSTPVQRKPGDWHLPYVTDDEWHRILVGEGMIHEAARDVAIKVSVARCARVSYLTQEGKTPSIGEDLVLYSRLMGSVPLHASPAEHQATPDEQVWVKATPDERVWAKPHLHGNFRGWIQYRKTCPGENQ